MDEIGQSNRHDRQSDIDQNLIWMPPPDVDAC